MKKKRKNSKSLIKKKINIGDTEILASYDPDSGHFEFGKGEGPRKEAGPYLKHTGEGGFKTMKALVNAFRDVAPEKIVYHAVGTSLKETCLKDKFYERKLRRLGYSPQGIFKSPHPKHGLGLWEGPERTWVKEKYQDKPQELEKAVASIIGISGIVLALFFLSPTLTGNAIANLATKTSSLIGAGLFIVGIVGSYFWIKKR
jgi:hypothetical protein